MQLLLFLSLVVLGSSVVESAAPRAGHRCCVADKWHGVISGTLTTLPAGSTNPTINQMTGLIDIDWDQKRDRIITSGVVNSQYPYNVTAWQDYTLHKQYNLMGGQCNSTDFPDKFFPPCIPGDFTYVGRTTIGSGDNSLQEDTWHGTFDNKDVYMGVAVGSCTPISYFAIGQDAAGTKQEFAFQYSNVVQESLRTPDAVDIPSKCLNH